MWRADRPQKRPLPRILSVRCRRSRKQFLINEVEFVHIYNEVFNKLGLKGYELRINSRKILSALAQKCGGMEKLIPITIAIDKLDKIGIEKVKEELREKELTGEQVETITQYLNIDGSNKEKIEAVEKLLNNIEDAQKGIAELNFILDKIPAEIPLTIDFTLARGLNYYTGIIFEAKAPAHINMGSIGGGGRYDDLTGLFGVPGIPGLEFHLG